MGKFFSLLYFNNKINAQDEWSYTGNCGPKNWIKLCITANGKRQSPINISKKTAKYDSHLNDNQLLMSYDLYSCNELTNMGHTFQISCNSMNSKLSCGPLKNQYSLLQFHAHWGPTNNKGSEHLVDNKYFAAELHFVHWNSEVYKNANEAIYSNKHDGLAVLGILIKIGTKNNTLQKIIDKFNLIKLKGQTCKIDSAIDLIDIKKLLPSNTSHYWTYQGSLTTPPCSESVQWIVFKEPIEISNDQIEAFRNIYKCKADSECCEKTKIRLNCRPVCLLNKREIKKSFQ